MPAWPVPREPGCVPAPLSDAQPPRLPSGLYRAYLSLAHTSALSLYPRRSQYPSSSVAVKGIRSTYIALL